MLARDAELVRERRHRDPPLPHSFAQIVLPCGEQHGLIGLELGSRQGGYGSVLVVTWELHKMLREPVQAPGPAPRRIVTAPAPG